MTTAAQAVRSRAAPEAARSSPAPAAAAPRGIHPSLRLGGLNDPEEHEAERAAGTIASGGSYRVCDPGGSASLRAAQDTAPVRARTEDTKVRAAAAAQVLDPGASSRIRRAVAAPILDPGAAGRIRSAPAPGGGSAGEKAAERIAHARSGVARPLPPAVQARLERGFGERLDGVRLHTGPAAHAAARAIGARAYTEGERITLGPGESEHDVRLLAHEATHVVQNRRAAGIARMLPRDAAAAPSAAMRRTAHESEVRRTAHGSEMRRTAQPDVHRAALQDVRPAPRQDVRRTPEQPIRRFPGLDTVLDKFADWANVIPGYRLLTIILGMNPINQAQVDRSGANILRAAVELIPFGGLIVKALEQYGIFEKGGAWLEQQVASLGMAGSALKAALMEFLDSLGLSDIIHPGDVWERAKRIFTEPIDRLIAFFKAVGAGIVDLIKDAILKPLAALASQTRAWDLLCAVLGKNPITGEPVERSPENLIGGFMKLAGQEEAWANIQKANALQRCWAWFQTTMGELLGFVAQVPGLFIAALKSFQVSDLLDLPGALVRVAGMFGNFVGQFISWALTAVWHLLEIVIDAVSPGALTYIKKTGAALKSILKNPMPFVGNLVRAAKLGLSNFSDNILTHLKAGLIDWLTGSLPGIYIPKALSLPEVGKFALSVLGITWAQIRAKIVKALGPSGEKIMQGLELAFDVVKALVTGGPAAAWEVIKEKLTNLKDMVFDAISGFVIDMIVKKAIPKLVSMFIPGAGFISAILSIYDTVTGFVRQLSKIAAAVKAFVDSIVAIAQGQIAGAAALVERSLAGVLSHAINLLASFLGLGGVADKIRGVIGRVQASVDKALDTAINWIVSKAKSLFARLFGKGDKKDERTDAEKQAALAAAMQAAGALLTAPGADPETARKSLPALKTKHDVRVLELVVDGEKSDGVTVHIHGENSPPQNTPPIVLANLNQIVAVTLGSVKPPGSSKVGKLDVNFQQGTPRFYEHQVGQALVSATGVPLSTGAFPAAIPGPGDAPLLLSQGQLGLQSLDPTISPEEARRRKKPDFALLHDNTVEIFEATLDVNFILGRSGSKTVQSSSKMAQITYDITALERMYPGAKIIYSIVAHGAMPPETKQAIDLELRHRPLTAELYWRS